VSAAAISILAFGAYLCAGGLLLLLAPEAVCRALAMAVPQGPWIRITGMLFLILSAYCWRAAREENTRFMVWSLYTRPTTIVFLAWFVAAGWVEPIVLAFGAVDVAASAWTMIALRSGDAARRAADGSRRAGARPPAV
jgi:hypothetical protein